MKELTSENNPKIKTPNQIMDRKRLAVILPRAVLLAITIAMANSDAQLNKKFLLCTDLTLAGGLVISYGLIRYRHKIESKKDKMYIYLSFLASLSRSLKLDENLVREATTQFLSTIEESEALSASGEFPPIEYTPDFNGVVDHICEKFSENDFPEDRIQLFREKAKKVELTPRDWIIYGGGI